MTKPALVVGQIAIPRDEISFSFSRSSGPGGQNVNKVNTKATLRWNVAQSDALPDGVRRRFLERYASRVSDAGELVVQSDTHREQSRNVTECLDRVRAMIQSVARPPRARKRTRPSRGAVEARLRQKRRRAEKKQRRRPPDVD